MRVLILVNGPHWRSVAAYRRRSDFMRAVRRVGRGPREPVLRITTFPPARAKLQSHHQSACPGLVGADSSGGAVPDVIAVSEGGAPRVAWDCASGHAVA